MIFSAPKTRRILWFVTFVVVVLAVMNRQLAAGDRDVLTTVFGDSYLLENSAAVLRKTERLEPERRFQTLVEFVFPDGDQRRLRMPVEFTAVNAPSAGRTGDTDTKIARERVQAGGQIASPLLDLVAVAQQSGQLVELRNRIQASADTRPADRIARLSALTVIDSAAGDTVAAARQLAEIYAIVAETRELREDSEGALLLAILSGARHAETRPAANDLAYDLHQTHLDLIPPSQWRPFHRHVAAFIRQLAEAIAQDSNADASVVAMPVSEFAQWHPGSLFTAESRGTGCPQNVWSRLGSEVHKNSGHQIDLLYFQSPLQGDFDVECDASVFNWRSIHPTYGGHWAGVESERRQRRIGTLAQLDSVLEPLETPLTKFRHEIHYRIAVRGQKMAVYGNGRLLNSVLLEPHHDPWLALRRSAKHSARIWNVRITGQPDIPSEIRLSESESLTGWIPYFNEGAGDSRAENAAWQQVGTVPGAGTIAGRYRPDLPEGSHAERLLYYHRPMLEDGAVEYEFFYKAEESLVHPAIDRLVFLLSPEGVKVHWVTDGVFDKSNQSPDNSWEAPASRRGPGELPLRDNQWNRLRVELRNDTVELFLNDGPVCQRVLENTNQRNFGLFHYADQTRAEVRNVVWKGDWPKTLPSVYDQELAGDDTRELDQSASRLASTFHHSFRRAQFPVGKIAVSAGNMFDVKPGPEGVHVQRQGTGGYQRTTLAAHLAVEGDFDISASFDSLVTRPGVGGHSSLNVSVQLDDPASTQTNYRRRHNRHPAPREDQHLAYADVASFLKSGVRRSNIGYQPAESDSGTLRVARRGNRLYTLFAEGDSKNFRITGESEFPEDNVALGGIILSGLVYQESFVSFRWTELLIRADRITGPAVEGTISGNVLVELNRKRKSLKASREFDFAKQAPSNEDFYRWGNVLPWSPELGGQLMIHHGRPTWSASGITPREVIVGDFDMTAVFDLRKIINPEAGDRSTIYLKANFGPNGDPHASLMFEINPDGKRQVYARVGTRKVDGGYSFRVLGGVAVADITALRIARYDKTMYFFSRSSGADSEQLIASTEVTDEPIPGRAVNFMVHSAGEGRETQAVLKSLKIQADAFRSVSVTGRSVPVRPIPARSVPPRPDNPPPKSRSFFDSVVDFFK